MQGSPGGQNLDTHRFSYVSKARCTNIFFLYRFEVLTICWEGKAAERPLFSELVQKMKDLEHDGRNE